MFAKRVLIWSVVACFAVFFGVDLATRGIQDVHGPMNRAVEEEPSSGSMVNSQTRSADHPAVRSPESSPVFRSSTGQRAPQEEPRSTAADPGLDEGKDELLHPADLYPYLYETQRNDTLVNKMADRTGSLVRKTANRGVDAFVSLFDAFIGTH